ncbi:hypothetical protein N7E02_08215 [Aliirhizobium terrae]|uniref:caspase family protein n=1 Tax=Terrirhizobium terrae TaxID=2926709 RepID=UPI00257531B7|nr:caspase family protein [Rhizobium sp. CC-CFT758]WJH40589.1 hypothetical protein N7E02_08215 [Rhizobium sp. CC-CFT758]
MRALIAIGCDIYDKPPLSTLAGAENDARAVYDHLVSSGWGAYDEPSSRILLSPTIAELKTELEDVLYSADVIEELTIFFAGHGGVKDGSYFLCLRDTDVDRMSFNALAMTQLFAWITEAKVGHTNVIIDACESGGVVHDIGVLLNPNVIGKVGSLAVSILAASGSDEYALETGGAGHCTTALMSCLRGDTVVQTTRPSLDLVEVGQVVSRMLQGKLQTPVSWGINLFGISQLSKNPCFAGGNAYIAEAFPGLTGDGAGNEHIRAASEAIWEQYLSLSREFNADSFLDVILPVCKRLESEPAMAVGFIEGLSSAFGARGAAVEDAFEAARVHAACAIALLPLAGPDGPVNIAIQSLAAKVVRSINEGIAHLLVKLNESKYALLGPNSGLADFYFLPFG